MKAPLPNNEKKRIAASLSIPIKIFYFALRFRLFEKINHIYGHLSGDRALQQFSPIMLSLPKILKQ